MSPTFWSCTDGEQLTHFDKNDAIEDYLDDRAEEMPEEITVYGYDHMKPTVNDIGDWRVLDDVLEYLDQEYGNPDGEGTGPTDKMKAACKVFLEAVIAEYEPWACEKVFEETIDVDEWVKEHRPDWLIANVDAAAIAAKTAAKPEP